MSLSTCEKCGGHIPLGLDASNICINCGSGVFNMSNELDPVIKLLKLSLTQAEAYVFNNKNDVRGFELKQELLSLVQRYEGLSKDRPQIQTKAEEIKDWYFTFGLNKPNAGHYIKISGTFNSSREEMFKRFGRLWSMQYDTLEKVGVEKYNLRELI
jgi:hypothetical protein